MNGKQGLLKYKLSYSDFIDLIQKTDYGIVCASTLSEATTILEDWYGQDNIASLTLEWVCEDIVCPTSEEIYNKLIEA